jgi:hypothetical protein
MLYSRWWFDFTQLQNILSLKINDQTFAVHTQCNEKMQFTKLMHHNGNQGFVHMHKISPNFYFKITTKIS